MHVNLHQFHREFGSSTDKCVRAACKPAKSGRMRNKSRNGRSVSSRSVSSRSVSSRSVASRPTATTYVEQVERHIGELEIFRQRVNAYPKHFEMYIDFKRSARFPQSLDEHEGLWRFASLSFSEAVESNTSSISKTHSNTIVSL